MFFVMPNGQSRPPLGKFWPLHATAWQTWKIGVSAGAVMEIRQTPETVSQGQRGNNIIICFQPLPWPRGWSCRAPKILLYTRTHTSGLHCEVRRPPVVVHQRSSTGENQGGMHHSGSAPSLWPLALTGLILERRQRHAGKVFCISLMEYSPSSPVRLHSPDRQIHTHSH